LAVVIRTSLRLTLFFIFASSLVWGQSSKNYEVLSVAFYNVENLFDTLNDPNTRDDDRTPEGRDRWTEAIYQKKVKNMARVLSEIGHETTGKPPAVIGLCEVENRRVVEDLLNAPELKPYNYGIVHVDSPDERGIDVALIYQKKHFLPIRFKSHALRLYNKKGARKYTRDQLLVFGLLEKEPVYVLVHHWPSRSGGQKRSEPNRLKAAALNKRVVDSILRRNPNANIINMGDFNDDPTNKSLAEVLKATHKKRRVFKNKLLYNPMMSFYKQGVGTACHRDTWSVLDQIHISGGLLKADADEWKFWKAGIFNKPYLITKEGRYKGYPFRSFSGGRFLNGYSDHFPVYAYLIREAD
jgi:endonuclease/exonuclease/phosphatase family metal-dependent hydrolase